MPRYDLISSAEVRAVFERTIRYFEALNIEEEDGDFDDIEEEDDATGHVIEALRFCAHAAGALRDPSLADVVFRALDILEHFDDFATGHQRVAFEALSSLLQAGLPADKRVMKLAGSSKSELRQALARGLDPRNPAGRALLDQLAADPVAEVRKSAKKALASVTEVPWWAGKWASDPAARLLPGEVEVAGPALRRVSELLDMPQYSLFSKEKTFLADLGAELERLPPALAVEAIEHFFRLSERYFFDQMRPLFDLLLAREGGVEAFVRLVAQWGSGESAMMYERPLAEAVKAAPPEVRLAICRRLLEVAAATPFAQRVEMAESPGWLAAAVVGEAWPPSVDVTQVLEVVLAMGADQTEGHRLDFVRAELVDAFKHEGVDPGPVLDQLCEARVAGFKGVWTGIGHRLEGFLARVPREVLRRTAERALHSEDPSTLTWAMFQLLGPVYDAEVDGPVRDKARAMFAEPRLRAAFMRDPRLVDRGLPFLREALRGGGLSYPDAVSVMEGIDRLYGGLAEGPERHVLRLDEADIRQQKAREEVQLFLGPEELGGPPTEGEWEALRRAREAFTAGGGEDFGRYWTRTLREGPWTAEERALLDELYQRFQGGDDKPAFLLGRALASKPDEELVGRFEAIIEGSDPDTRPLLRQYRNDTRAALGLLPVGKRARGGGEEGVDPEGEEGAGPPGDDWDDEDDD